MLEGVRADGDARLHDLLALGQATVIEYFIDVVAFPHRTGVGQIDDLFVVGHRNRPVDRICNERTLLEATIHPPVLAVPDIERIYTEDRLRVQSKCIAQVVEVRPPPRIDLCQWLGVFLEERRLSVRFPNVPPVGFYGPRVHDLLEHDRFDTLVHRNRQPRLSASMVEPLPILPL